MKNYVKRKLPYSQVHRVVSLMEKKGLGGMMQQIRQPFIISGVPEGFYCLVADGILLPKKRRGEKFLVMYTQMLEKEF